jgi:hypothetical protein
MVDNNPKIVVLEKLKVIFLCKKLGFWFIPMLVSRALHIWKCGQ